MSQYSEQLSDLLDRSELETFIREEGMGSLLDQVNTGESPSRIYAGHGQEDLKLFHDVDPLPMDSLQHNYIGSASNCPPSEPKDVCSEEYVGPYNFEVCIVPNDLKTPWEYSIKLNKIFIGMGLKFPVTFSLNNDRPPHQLFVRATPVFSQSHHFKEVVHRCIAHEANKQDPSNKDLPDHMCQHIIRCSHDETIYFGDKNANKRLNLVVPLGIPQTGTDVVREYFQFVCKNSCPSGMNRRPIEVIFTLEDVTGEILGRRAVAVRICSCPKRDREKEEKDLEKANVSAQGKKRKEDSYSKIDPRKDAKKPHSSANQDVDHKPVTLTISFPNVSTAKEILIYGRSTMADKIVSSQNRHSDTSIFKKAYNDFNDLIDGLPKE